MKEIKLFFHTRSFLFFVLLYIGLVFPGIVKAGEISNDNYFFNNKQVDSLPPTSSFDVYNRIIANDFQGHVYYFWMESIYARGDSARLLFRSSNNGGRSFAGKQTLIPASSAPFGYDALNMCNDNTGNVYLLWQYNAGYSADSYLHFNRSSDYGVTWQGVDQRIANIPQGAGYLYPQMTCDQQGHVYVAWKDYRENNGTIKVFFNYSSDFGSSWQGQDIKVSTSDTGKVGDNLILKNDNRGHVYLAWGDSRLTGGNNIFYNYSSNYGATWQSADVRIDNNPNYAGVLVPTMTTDQNGHVYVAWSDSRSGVFQAYLNYSSDYGATWKGEKRIDNNPLGIFTDPIKLASDNKGHVYATWTTGLADFSNTGKTFFNYSSDYGLTWQGIDKQIDSSPSNYEAHGNQLAVNNIGGVYDVWIQEPYCYPRCINAADIYYNYSEDYGVTWQTSGIRVDNAPDNTEQDQPIISSSFNNVFIGWTDNRNNSTFGDPLINFYTSTNPTTQIPTPGF